MYVLNRTCKSSGGFSRINLNLNELRGCRLRFVNNIMHINMIDVDVHQLKRLTKYKGRYFTWVSF